MHKALLKLKLQNRIAQHHIGLVWMFLKVIIFLAVYLCQCVCESFFQFFISQVLTLIAFLAVPPVLHLFPVFLFVVLPNLLAKDQYTFLLIEFSLVFFLSYFQQRNFMRKVQTKDMTPVSLSPLD